MPPPRTYNGVLRNYQETEIVFINSSPVNLIGLPVPRVLKRKNNHYMRPRSPVSPTLKFLKYNEIPTSGSREARLKRDFLQTQGMS